jgi:hypothetical protein
MVPAAAILWMACGGGSAPGALSPGAGTGTVRMDKTTLFEQDEPGLILDLRAVDGRYVAASRSGACDFDLGGTVSNCVRFRVNPGTVGAVRIVSPRQNDGITFVMTIAGGREDEIRGLDGAGWTRWSAANGARPWRFGLGEGGLGEGRLGEGNMQGDGPGDGAMWIATLRPSDTALLPVAGGKPAHLDVVGDEIDASDLDGDGKSEILVLTAGGMLESRTPAGAPAGKAGPLAGNAGPIIEFMVARAAGEPGVVIARDDDHLLLLGPDLAVRRRLSFPDRPWAKLRDALHLNGGAILRGRDGSRAVALLLGGRGGWHRTVLLVAREDGALLYDEVLDGDFTAITAVDGERFLLGGRGTVLLYRMRQPRTGGPARATFSQITTEARPV